MNIYSQVSTPPKPLDKKQILNLQDKLTKQTKDKKLTNIAKALAEPTKLKIFLLLKQIPEVSVGDISRVTGLGQSTVSHALSDLKKLGIIRPRRCGQLICYSINDTKETNSYLNKLSYMLI